MSNHKKILLLGASGTLGNEINKLFKLNNNYEVICPPSSVLNFKKLDSKKNLYRLIDKYKFDVIINCIGVFGGNTEKFADIINPNLRSNWEIINYFIINKSNKKIKIFFIGSSSYSGPRKKYMLYAASKSALNSLYKSAKEFFFNKKIDIYIKNPKPFKSKMTGFNNNKKFKNDASIIAKQIYKIIKK